LAKWRRFKKIGHSETRIACGGHDMYVWSYLYLYL
jgi:hypothetical protein